MEERSLYKRGKVSVTPSKLIVANKSYIIKNIASASVETIPANKIPLAIILVAGILIMLVKGMLLIGAVIVVIAIVFYVLMKDEYVVRVNAANGDSADTFTTKDRAYADEILAAVNEAIGLSAYSYYTNQPPTNFSTDYKL